MDGHTLLALIVGAVFGFIGSMPVAGPIAVLVLERGLLRRSREGLGLALGAAVAESLYAFLAFWGMGTVLRKSPALLPTFRLIGACVLVALGIYLATRSSRRARVAEPPPEPNRRAGRDRTSVVLGLSITLVNPTILATWTVVVAAVHSTGLVSYGVVSAAAFALGVGGGIVGWFATMLYLLRRFERGVRPATVDRVLHIAGWAVVVIGLGIGIQPLAQAVEFLRS